MTTILTALRRLMPTMPDYAVKDLIMPRLNPLDMAMAKHVFDPKTEVFTNASVDEDDKRRMKKALVLYDSSTGICQAAGRGDIEASRLGPMGELCSCGRRTHRGSKVVTIHGD